MSVLPEWLWPLEDEEAVQEAERLIEETHNTLRRMEADMHAQRNLGQHLSEETEKLKAALNNRILSLEKELKTISEPKDSDPSLKQPGCNKSKSFSSSSKFIGTPKLSSKVYRSSAHPQPHTISSFEQAKSKQFKTSVNTAEKVVLTAKAKVQDALSVARNVSASLDQHVYSSSHQSKPLSTSQTSNIRFFEVKSQADEKKEHTSKQRLQQALLPAISIKCGLERQSIPSIHVLPGEKLVPVNVSVYNMKHDERINEQPTTQKDKKYKEGSKSLQNEKIEKNCSSSIGVEDALAQLSKQLSEVEELREINQAQVNHVLRFLLSRVCASNHSAEKSEKPPSRQVTPVNEEKNTKASPPTSMSSCSSGNSQYPIAYDSLSRFLETYKRAAEHNMLARKRADARKQRVAIKQKKDIEQAQTGSEDHLLIGPLRQIVKLTESAGLIQSVTDFGNVFASHSSSSSLHQQGDICMNKESGEDNSKGNKNETNTVLGDKEKLYSHHESPQSSSQDSSALVSLKPSGEISGEEYEDDWEEEEIYKQVSDEQSVDPSLQPIVEEEHLSSSLAQIQKTQLHHPGIESLEEQLRSLDVTPVTHLTVDLGKTHTVCESLSKQEQPLVLKGASILDPSLHGDSLNNVGQDQLQQIGKKIEDTEIHGASKILTSNKVLENNCDNSPKMALAEESLALPNDLNMQKTTEHLQIEAKLKCQSMPKRTQMKFLNSCSSSSDGAISQDCRLPPRTAKRWDLNLREDLQLQSAMLLNWQLEDRWKNRGSEGIHVKDQSTLQTQQKELIADVEKRWQQTLDLLNQRLKTVEDNEKIHRIANNIQIEVREEKVKASINETVQTTAKEKSQSKTDKVVDFESKVPTKDQMVQTSPEKPQVPLTSKELDQLLFVTKDPQNVDNISEEFGLLRSHGRRQRQEPISWKEDLTTELLAYSRMGIIPKQGYTDQPHSKSPSSSTSSSHFQYSSIGVSLSDGELRDSGSGSASCSCSEGEFCVCGGRKLCSKRAPPDGSQNFSDGENFIKDISQGEIPASHIKHLLRDTSQGEVDTLPGAEDLVEEESFESDGIVWAPQ